MSVARNRWRWSAGTLTRTLYGLTEYPSRPVNPYGTRARPDSAV